MKSQILRSVNRLMILFVVAFALLSSNNTEAQPYCQSSFANGSPYANVYWYDFFAYFARVSMQKSTSTGVDEYARVVSPTNPIPPVKGSGQEQFKHTQNPEINMKVGNTYQFRLNVHGFGPVYTRMFIDLNGDGDFQDVVNGQNEFRGTIYTSHPYTYDFNLPYPDYYLKTNQIVTTVGMPEFPGLEKVLETAEKMYAFVNQGVSKK